MSKRFVSILVMLFTCFFAGRLFAQEMEVIFSDDFSSYQTDADLLKKWVPFQGHWFVKEGSLHQDNGGFDQGILVRDLYLRCDYRIETKVKLVSGGAGAGFYWNVADSIAGENGNMLRYDGNKPIMTGWMRGRGFVGTGGATGDLEANDKWHDFRMDVKNGKGTMDLYWDGKKILEDGGIFHRSGYVGLECSLGYCAFDDVKISVAKGTDWRAIPRGVVKPEWIQSLAILPDGNIVYPVRNLHRIQVVSTDGKLVREFGEMGQGSGQMYLPAGVATDKQSNIYVTEAGNNRVQVFTSEGKSLKVITPSNENALKQPMGIAVEPTGQIWVSDSGNNRVVMLADDGSIPAKIGAAPVAAEGAAATTTGKEPGQFQNPGHLNIIDGKLFVADSGNRRIQVFDPRNPAAPPQVIPIKETDPYSVASDGRGNYLIAGGRGVMTYDKDWKLIKDYYGDATGEIWPLQAVYGNDGNIIIADWWSHRLIVTEPTLYPVTPEITDITTDSAVVKWATDLPTPTKLLLLDTPQGATWPSSIDYSKAKVCGDGLMRMYHVVELKGLKPTTRYTFSITSPRKVIPENGHSVDYRFSTKAPAGMMAYTEVPIAIICYANVTFNANKGPDGKVPPPAIRDDAWVNQVKKAHEGMRYFYWFNSYFRLDTKCYYYKVTRPVDFAYLGSSSEEIAKDLEALAKREKMKATDFGAVLTIGGSGTYAYPWPTPWWGGKLTYTTGCCFCGGGDMWIGTHEFHHLTEGWMRMIGVPNYTCADTPWVHPSPIGENYDFLASTLRMMTKETYFNLAVGKLKTLVDKDGDCVPDNAPDLPFDEKRGETDPNNKDTYRNGLTELQNVTAEIFNQAVKGHKHPLLTKEINRKFPFAIFSYDYERKKKTPVIDGKMTGSEWDKFASTPNGITPDVPKTVWAKAYPPVPGANYTMDTYLNWDDGFLYFAAAAPYKFLMEVQLDCNGDGYFAGNDNPRMTFVIPRDETNAEAGKPMPVPGVMVWNNVEPVQATGGPNWTNEYFDQKDNIKWIWGKRDDGWYIIEAAIPRCPRVSLNPGENKEMAVRLWLQGFLPPTEKDKDPRFTFEMFDSCEYGYFKLVK